MRLPTIFAVLAVLGGHGALPAFAADTPSVLVIEGPGTVAPKTRRRDIRPTIEHAAKQAGADIVGPHQVPTGLLDGCADSTCATRAAAAAKASHVVLAEAAYVEDGFKIRLELYDVRSGRQVGAEGQSCQVCTFPAFLKALRESTAVLCTRGFNEPPPVLPAPTPVATPSPAPATQPTSIEPTVLKASPSPTALTETPPSTLRKVLPMVGVGVGVATMAAGAFYLSKNGDPGCGGDNDRCPYKRSTLAGGGTLLGLGALATGASAYFWYTTPNGRKAVALTPTSVAIMGRF